MKNEKYPTNNHNQTNGYPTVTSLVSYYSTMFMN